MINPKYTGISAGIGFFLSFFIGLISGDVRFSHILLRAFFSALGCGVLCVAITFIFKKFLDPDSSGFGEGDLTSSKGGGTTGNIINIVVDDSALPDDGLAPKFTVMQRHAVPESKPDAPIPQSATNPVQASDPVAAEDSVEPIGLENPSEISDSPAASGSSSPASEQGASFKPVSLNQVSSPNPSNGQSAPSQNSSNAVDNTVNTASNNAPKNNAGDTNGNSGETLDVLPDMGDIEVSSSSASATASDFDDSSSVGEVINDTDFATGGAGLKEQPISGDTAVMAKAIQTLLKKED